MKLSPKAIGPREAVVGGAILFLLLGGCYLLVLGLRQGGWLLTVAACLIEIGYFGMKWFTESGSHIGRLIRAVKGWLERQRQRRAERKYRQNKASEMKALTLASLEERVNALVELRIERRLAELERAEESRSREEWTELRDVWRVLILDPNTPEEVRASCREWLAKYPETLDFLARRLVKMGLLREKDLVVDENWEQREQHKWRVQ